MSVLAARRRAERLVQELGYDRPAIPVVEIAQGLGLRVVPMDLQSEGLSGMLITQPGLTPAIIVNLQHHPHRKRFTIAHEVGHYVLRHHERGSAHVLLDRTFTYRGSRASSGLDPIEIAANHFASALLMPTYLVVWYIREKQIDPNFDDDIADLARDFDVSVQAMTIRLSSLRYF